ncbi:MULTISPECIES: four-carbon acid sugar kinase family protein [Billgrantia]|uniref:Four-carbon acid sugar kinase family protein n=1 Tax=Billgrantia ethanolica TaxID=2733486 RepID=A0ABS9A7U2_9GAMM|nr:MULTISPECIES: four-carbon acid sugar kinase family protein [Halomonas]MCE8004901.1 four-carbon acid sugar kinase family protein [Halomonas ethanolica]MCE8011708.1 four-carbon acid sugar kinase family protein [Halomonas desiderata]
MSRCRVAIVADDLTGALDAAAPFAARGAQTRVVVALERLASCLEAWAENGPQVVAVNTESRHLPSHEAAERVVQATRLLARLSPEVWFKKIDSTLRGQVVAESLAMLRVTGRQLWVAPAVPAQQRVVRDAEVWVEGRPLKATPYGADARSPSLKGPLDTAFGAAGVTLARRRAGAGFALPEVHCVVDASSQQDLATLYDDVARRPERWLLVGAAGLASEVARRSFGLMHGSAPWLSHVAHRLYAVGSRSPRALEQCRRLREGVPDLDCEAALSPRLPRVSAHRLLVPGDEGSGVLDPADVALAMGERIAAIVAEWPRASSQLLFLTGGDTAMAALSCLGARFIEVVAEWRPGVALGYLDGEPQHKVMTKAGGFGDAELLLQLHAEVAHFGVFRRA